jgi:hypothetical protein
MTHDARRDQLADLALGLLEPDAARALQAHAGTCATCRAELAALQQTRALMAGLPAPEAPPRGAVVVMAAARQAAEAAGERRPRWAVPRWLAGGALGVAGAAALAVLVIRVAAPPSTGPLGGDDRSLLGQGGPPGPGPGATVGAPAAAPALAKQADAAPTPAASLVVARPADAAPVETPAAPRPGVAQAVPVQVARSDDGRSAAPAGQATAAIGARDASGEAGVAGGSARAALPPAPATATVLAPPPAPTAARPPAAEAKAKLAEVGGAGEASVALREESPAPQRRSEAAAAPLQLQAPPPEAARAAVPAAEAERAPCRMERRRVFRRDEAGQVVARLREGRYPAEGGEVPLSVEERFEPGGRLLGATVRAGDRLITVSEVDLASGRVEPLPGVLLAATAAEAQRAPPRCEP